VWWCNSALNQGANWPARAGRDNSLKCVHTCVYLFVWICVIHSGYGHGLEG